MLESKFEDRHFVKYLRLLGIEKQRPNFEYLKEIINVHSIRIPFENISKLYFLKRLNLKRLIDFELYLDGIEKYGFGGTCYANNFYLNQLLFWLGFNIKLCGADMKNPDVHIVNIVNIENREFLIDAGCAAPFSEPLPLDLPNDYIIKFGDDRYIIKPKTNKKQSHLEIYRNEKLVHGYRVNPKTKTINEFRQVIKDSFKESSTFMNALLLTRFDSGNFIIIHNMSIIESSVNLSKNYLINSIEQLTLVINKYFNIPKSIIRESIENLQMQKSGWS